MNNKLEIAKLHVDKLVKFLSDHVKLSQGHMVDYFIHNLYQNCIPLELRREISDLGYDEAVNILLSDETKHKNVDNLLKFINQAKSYSLYNLKDICLSKSEFYDLYNFEDVEGLKLDVFMKEKKSHEVATLSLLAKNIAGRAKTSHLVDIGDGKGYLSSMIAFHHKLPILGVDGSLINTESSIKRANKLEKHWEHVTKTKTDETNKEYNNRIFLYKQITQLVTEKTNFNELIQTVFLEEPTGIGLVGLHTCGNLGPTSLRIFNENNNIKSIVNVSCCYHLLNENYLANSAMGCITEDKQGFPMSAYMTTKHDEFLLLRATRMLSAHSLDRILHNQELPSKIIFYRALLEILLERINFKGKHVGKFRKQPDGFVKYARVASEKLGITLEETDGDLQALFDEYKDKRRELEVFYLIRSMLAPAIEALILLDRFLFLLEQGHEDVFLVHLFDAVISPRCYGLVALR